MVQNSNGSKRHKEHRNKIEIPDPDAYKGPYEERRENLVKPARYTEVTRASKNQEPITLEKLIVFQLQYCKSSEIKSSI